RINPLSAFQNDTKHFCLNDNHIDQKTYRSFLWKTEPRMIGASTPFLYRGHNAAFSPTSTFDPKSVTRASWKPKPRKPTHYGPLLSFNIPAEYVSDHLSLRNCIKWLRVVQLLCRILEFTGGLSISVLLVFVTNIDGVTEWILRILPGVAMLHCLCAIYHLSRKASGRSPGSTAAYHVFAAILDFVILSLHALGAYSTYQESSTWRSRLSDQDFVRYFGSAIYYIVIIRLPWLPSDTQRTALAALSESTIHSSIYLTGSIKFSRRIDPAAQFMLPPVQAIRLTSTQQRPVLSRFCSERKTL
ncbi:hypothetical protein E4U43_008343, partial [Claviceps pusilla]